VQDTDPTPAVSQDQALVAWLRLALTPGVGPVTAKLLLARFKSPFAIFSASHAALRTTVSDAVARALLMPMDSAQAAAVDAVHEWRAQPGNQVLTQQDAAWPALLRELPDPPVVLYAKGRTALLAGAALAIVGSRNATVQGRITATSFAEALSCAGITIVSGLALGIDAAAHEGGLRGAGSTVAVVGTGADRIYPRRNRDLAHRIAADGCVLSEYPLGTQALAANFPRRNRLISGLSCGVLVVEAAAESGSLITANVANDQGREVFAIPGSIHSPLSKGCHKLIQSGAHLIASASELLTALAASPLVRAGLPMAAAASATASATGSATASPSASAMPDEAAEFAGLLHTLGQGPVHGDTLADLVSMPVSKLSAQLMALELAGQVERLPGGLFQRVNR
jgi:DNA processing protein